LLVHPKIFQRLGYLLWIRDTSEPILRHITEQVGIEDRTEAIERLDGSKTRKRHMRLVREYLGVTAVGEETRTLMHQASLEAAATKDEVADIINVVLEKLARNRFELPAFTTLAREAQAARAAVNRQCFESIHGRLDDVARARIDAVLSGDPSGQHSSLWAAVKEEPKQSKVKNT
jgi:hypothetical protein